MYCTGNNNTMCTSHCFGNNNRVCLDYCQGNKNTLCVPPNHCRNAAGIALAADEIRAPGLLAAVAAVGARIYATPPPAVQPMAALT
jgi:hypothetical protein